MVCPVLTSPRANRFTANSSKGSLRDKMKSKPLFLFLALLGLTVMLFGQATDSNLTGTVNDPSGAALPGAKVELTNEATGVKTATTTDTNGLYRFNNMPIGRYDVTASASGFTSGTMRGLDL